MSKFLDLCEQVQKNLQEQNEPQMDPNAGVAPGEPVEQPNIALDPNTQSEVKDVSNEKIQQLIQTIVNFFKDNKTLTADDVSKLTTEVPSEINIQNSEETVDKLLSIFQSATFPEDTSGTIAQ
jgi:hypothetical protein